MLSHGQDIEVLRVDLQAAVGPIAIARRPPKRFAPSKILSLRRTPGALVVATANFDAGIECRGIWNGTLMVDSFYFKTAIQRLPAVETIRLVGWEARLAIIADRYQITLPAVDVKKDIVFRRFFYRLYPAPVEELPLFARRLI
jgi:hypothetical protein